MLRIAPPIQKPIAVKLGVSQALVSSALSGRSGKMGDSKDALEKIRRAAAKSNFQPGTAASGAPTRTIGVAVKNFDDPYFGRLIGALQALARENGDSLLLTGSSKEDLSGLQKHRVDGVILAGSDFRPEGLRTFACEGMPVVQIGAGSPFPGATQIHFDEEAGIGELIAYLAGLGHREIGFVAEAGTMNRRRGEILRRGLRSRGLSARTKSFFFFDGPQVGERAVKALLGLSRLPTAVIAAQDSTALVLLRGFHEAGVRVPRDISIAGIDDIAASAQAIPPLTTLRQPISEMAAAAFHALAQPGENTVSMPGKLIVRRSCAPFRSY